METNDNNLNDTAFALPEEDSDSATNVVSEQSNETVLDVAMRKDRRKVYIITASIVGIIVVSLALVFGLNKFITGSEQPKSGELTPGYDSQVGHSSTRDDAKFYEKAPSPEKMEQWQEGTVEIDSDNNVHVYDKFGAEVQDVDFKNVINGSINPTLLSAVGALPSEANGFTPDLDKETLDDGSLNPMFSYWTQEQIGYELSVITETLLNPLFGGWSVYTMSDMKANENFKLTPHMSMMFTENYLTNNSGKSPSEWVPIYADWNANDYGMADVLVPDSSARWFGKITHSTLDYTYDEETGQYSATMNANVVFTAWTQDEKTVKKNGTLSLSLVSNANGAGNNVSPYRVLIDSATLNVE